MAVFVAFKDAKEQGRRERALLSARKAFLVNEKLRLSCVAL